MPLTKVLNKAHSKKSTHSHYKGEFTGAQELNKKNANDHEYRAARAKHFAGEASKAHDAHATAKNDKERAEHLATASHAAKRAAVHAAFVKQRHPGSELADEATKHAELAKHLHESMKERGADQKAQKVRVQKKQDEAEKRKLDKVDAEEKEKKAADEPLSTKSISDHELESMRNDFLSKIGPKERDACLQYSGADYKPINTGLRTNKLSKSFNDSVDDLDYAISKTSMQEHTLVHRGAGSDTIEHFSGLRPGDSYVERGYTSTSTQEGSFKGGVKLLISIPKGGKGAPIPSIHPVEREILLPRNQKYRVNQIHHDTWEDGKPRVIVHVTAIQE